MLVANLWGVVCVWTFHHFGPELSQQLLDGLLGNFVQEVNINEFGDPHSSLPTTKKFIFNNYMVDCHDV